MPTRTASWTAARLPGAVFSPHGLHEPEPGPHGALGIVFMRLGIAKIDQQPIAQVLGDMPLEAPDHPGTGLP